MKFPKGRKALHISDREQLVNKSSMSHPGRRMNKTRESVHHNCSVLGCRVVLSLQAMLACQAQELSCA